jgi:hypothetical protein
MARSYKKIAELQSEQIYDNHSKFGRMIRDQMD